MVREIGNLSILGFLDGLTATIIITTCVAFGLISFYKAKKLEAKLLGIAGITMILTGCLWLGPATDFFTVMITGNNLPNVVYVWLSYMWVSPAVIVAFYLGSELMMPEKKKIIVIIYGVLGIIFEILIFSMPEQVFVFQQGQVGDLIDSGFVRTNPAYWLIIAFLISILVFLVIGFGIKAKQATGELRKKFGFLSLGFLIFFIAGVADALFLPGVYLVIWRGLMATFAIFMYLGLKT